jgi:hypothetical protein
MQQGCEIPLYILGISLRRLTIDTHGPVFAGPPVGFPQEAYVDMVSECRERQRWRLSGQCRYPLE